MTVATNAPSYKERHLPPGWRIVRFDQMAANITDRVDDPAEAGVESYVGLEHLDPESLHIRRWGHPTDVGATKLRFEPGDIIFGRRRAYQRKLAVADFEGICSAHALVLRAREEAVLPEFLPFFMQSDLFFERALQISVGSLSPTINWRTLAKEEFPLPPKEEQRRIADILWAADEALQTRTALLRELQSSRQAVIDGTFDLECSSVASESAVLLRDVCRMQNGRPFPSSAYSTTGIRLLRPGNLGEDGYCTWTDGNTVHLPDEYVVEAGEYLLRPEDIVINLTAQSLEEGFMGRVCLIGAHDESLLNQRIGRFICNDALNPAFLFRCLQTSRFRALVERRCEGSKIKHLFWSHIEDFRIPFPDWDRQLAVVRRIGSSDQSVGAIRSAISSTQCLLHELRNQLITPTEGLKFNV